jgi:SET domain/Domain of unknown function (DUF3331)
MSTNTARNPLRKITVRGSRVHGRGVFATRPIGAAEFICDYRGERITWNEAVERHPHDPSQPNHTFYFDIGDGFVIDGAVGGNSARWINHSCAPNCDAVDNGRKISIRTIRDVSAGEELGIDYALTVSIRRTAKLRAQYACHCGSLDCRGTMLATQPWRVARTRDDVPVVQADGHKHAAPVVRVFERQGPDTIVVSWREPGRCCYTEQRWEKGRATKSGVCALSGEPFAAGALVFRPVGVPKPLNAEARIAECHAIAEENVELAE